MRWLMAATLALALSPAQAAEGWVAGDLMGAAVMGSDGRALGELTELYVDRAGRVRAARLEGPGGVVMAPWPSLRPDRSGHLVRLSGGVQRNGVPPADLVPLSHAIGAPVMFESGVAYGRVATVRISRAGVIEAVFIKPAAPAAQLYPLAWSALDYVSLFARPPGS